MKLTFFNPGVEFGREMTVGSHAPGAFLVLIVKRYIKFLHSSPAELTGSFLKREWIRSDGERESGAKFNEALQFLLR